MQLYSDKVCKIYEPKAKRTFLIWTVFVCIFEIPFWFVEPFHPLEIISLPVIIIGIFLLVTSGESLEYELRDLKIYYKKTVVFRSIGKFGKGPPRIAAPDDRLEVRYTVSALYGFRFEQTSAEKRKNIGRIYFCGITSIDADRPFTAFEKRCIPKPNSYVLYGVRNFENVKKELLAQLQSERENNSV